MKIDPVSLQESTPTGLTSGTAGAAFATAQGLAEEVAEDEKGLRVLSRLSYCVAWLFGLEAFFMEPAAAGQAGQGFEGRGRE
ncbi:MULTISPECIES: hypothetical protein [unclassified Paraburkholderia]|uniref:hypothetical protein n=1 Tax=unclassified Paraburkholderia TaxID=2615204 RepID=UPI002AB012BD|nr:MULTISPECIES: hypothetical protein [unclassified Paraburkholderia]